MSALARSPIDCLAVFVIASFLCAGCADLLPRARTEVASPWRNYEQARATIDRIVPYQTSGAELRALGVDPFATPNVQVLTFSDILLRFPVASGVAFERLDKGLRECLEAGKGCQGYSVTVREMNRDRVGNFWLDALSFERIVAVNGWSFNAIVLLVDGRVVYVTQGGQPVIRERESNNQPLGPLQGWGDALPGMIR